MTGKTHLSGGLAAAVIVERTAYMAGYPLMDDRPVNLFGFSVPVAILAFAIAALGSLLPDLDEPNSLVSNLPRAGRGIARSTLRARGVEGAIRSLVEFGLLAINFIPRALSGLVKMVAFGHRGATHWLITAVILSLLGATAGMVLGYPALGLWLLIGYTSHLVLDAMTISGLAMLKPFSDRKVHLLPGPLRIRTDSFFDNLVGLTLVAAAVIVAAGTMAISLEPEKLRRLWRLALDWRNG